MQHKKISNIKNLKAMSNMYFYYCQEIMINNNNNN